jgi:hypothetical protein
LSFIASTTITNNPNRNYHPTLAQRWHTHLEEEEAVAEVIVVAEEDFLVEGVIVEAVEVFLLAEGVIVEAAEVSLEVEDEVSF